MYHNLNFIGMGQSFFWSSFILVKKSKHCIWFTWNIHSRLAWSHHHKKWIDWVAISIARILYQFSVCHCVSSSNTHLLLIPMEGMRCNNRIHSGMIGFHRFFYLVSCFIQSNGLNPPFIPLPWKSRKCTNNLSHSCCNNNSSNKKWCNVCKHSINWNHNDGNDMHLIRFNIMI